MDRFINSERGVSLIQRKLLLVKGMCFFWSHSTQTPSGEGIVFYLSASFESDGQYHRTSLNRSVFNINRTMAWSKRNRLLLAIAVAVGLTAFVCIAVAIGAWRATVNQQAVATNASDITTPSRVPNRAPTPVPRAPLEETSSPASSGTRTTLTPLTPLPSDNPTQRPTHQPTGAPTRPPTGFATTTPSRSATQFPTSSPTQARSDESDRTLTTFYVVADVPYNQVEAAQLPPQVRNLPDDAEFLLVRCPCNPYPIHNKSS